jgi:hypothetical protein
MNKNKIKVLYIAGWGRSGSTILGNILGEIDGFFHAGEVGKICKIGLSYNWNCGCGLPFKQCKLWKRILKNIQLKKHTKMMLSLERCVHNRQVPLLIINPKYKRISRKIKNKTPILEELYKSIQYVTHSKVIVDSSKTVSYAYVLNKISKINLYIIHLVRDPRAIAYSWRKKIKQMHIFSPTYSSINWLNRNIASEFFKKEKNINFLQISYENFITEPKKIIRNILNFVEEKASNLPFVDKYKVKLNTNHTIWGNPNRIKTGIIKLKFDNEWKTKMKLKHKLLVTILTFPLLLKYGYLKKRK